MRIRGHDIVTGDVVLGLTSDDSSVTVADNGDGTLDLSAAGGGSGVVESIVAGTGISVDSTDPANPIVSASGGGGSASTLLLDATATPDDDVPGGTAVGTLIFMKSDAPAPVTWDFRGLSALPTGWARRGVASETFDAAGMSATYAAGQGHYFALPGTVEGTLEAKLVTGPATSSNFLGPIIFGPANIGAAMTWYTGAPPGALLIGVNSSHQYDSTFTSGGGTAGYPVWFRVRFATTTAHGSFSTNGTTWSSEVNLSKSMAGVNEIGIGSIAGSASAKTEYVTWSQSSATAGGLIGWWDGSTIVGF